jgi:hypothetical protein
MTLLDAINKVHAALTGLANALETGDADRVLAAEQPLAEATTALETVDRARLTDEVHLRARLLEARLALERCRALGDASAEMLNVLHPNSGYERTGGHRRLRDAIARAVNSQV